MFYVYILRSLKDSSLYIGYTSDLNRRLREHKYSDKYYSSSRKPLKLIWYCVFNNKDKAIKFEEYLKKGSGNAFLKKRLVS
jgi:putative endonuclease